MSVEDQSPSFRSNSNQHTAVWTQVASNNEISKSQRHDRCVGVQVTLPYNYVSTSNRFALLSNLEGDAANIQPTNEHSSTQKSHKITNHSSKGNKIPTLVIGFLDSYIELPRVKRQTDRNIKRY